MEPDDYVPPLSDLERADAAHPRHAQVALGPSDSGGCPRAHAYAHHDVPMSDPERARDEARLGSLIHKGYASVIASLDDDMRAAEVPLLIPGLRFGGTADDVDWRAKRVTDAKTAKDRTWHRWNTHGLPDSWWEQVDIYGYAAMLQTGEHDGWTVAVLLLNRETGQEALFERPADFVRGERLAHALAVEQEALDASDPDEVDEFERTGHGPGTGFPCDWCPWLTRCWGHRRDGMSPQALTIVDDPDLVEQVGEDYLAASEAEAKAKDRKQVARAYLDGIPAGAYGMVTVKWQGGNRKPGGVDTDAAVARLTELDEPIPYRPDGRTATSIRVIRTPPDPVGL